MKAVASVAATAFAVPHLLAQTLAAGKPQLQVWKDPDCGCCGDWVKHLEANGFAVQVYAGGTDAARNRLGMPARLASCHTAMVGGYAIEGHVPAKEIHRLLKERPAATGLTVPGMPVGSPGMDLPVYGGRQDPYDVLLVARNGGTSVYQSYNAAKPKTSPKTTVMNSPLQPHKV
jgi:hypothetical protein